MAYDPESLLRKVHSFLAASGRFPGGAGIGEPKSAPASMFAAVLLGDIRFADNSLATSSARMEIIVRVYRNAFSEPLENTELTLGKTAFELLEDFAADFDFGDSSVRGPLPLEVQIRLGYIGIGPAGGQTMYRTMDITLPIVINDVVTWTK